MAQTLILTRVATPPWRLSALPTRTQKVGSVKSTLSKTVRTRPLRSASAGRKSQRIPLQCR